MYPKKTELRPGTAVRHRFSFLLYSAVLLSALAGAFLLKSADVFLLPCFGLRGFPVVGYMFFRL